MSFSFGRRGGLIDYRYIGRGWRKVEVQSYARYYITYVWMKLWKLKTINFSDDAVQYYVRSGEDEASKSQYEDFYILSV